MSNAMTGQGTSFYAWNPYASSSATAAWEKIAEVTSISGPDKSRDTIDVTTLDTTTGYREFIGALRDPGSITLSINYTRDEYERFNTYFESDETQNFEIRLPDSDNTTLEFAGLVDGLPLEIPVDEKVTAEITIKISGKVTINSGSGSSGA